MITLNLLNFLRAASSWKHFITFFNKKENKVNENNLWKLKIVNPWNFQENMRIKIIKSIIFFYFGFTGTSLGKGEGHGKGKIRPLYNLKR